MSARGYELCVRGCMHTHMDVWSRMGWRVGECIIVYLHGCIYICKYVVDVHMFICVCAGVEVGKVSLCACMCVRQCIGEVARV